MRDCLHDLATDMHTFCGNRFLKTQLSTLYPEAYSKAQASFRSELEAEEER